MRNETATIVIFSSAIATLFFGRYLRHLTTTLFLFDALGLGLFTIVGIKLGMEKQFSMGICIALGAITACFGGVVRDVLLNHIPLLFRKEIYAMACIAGGLVYFGLLKLSVDADMVTVLAILFIFILRVLAVKWKWSLPRFYEMKSAQDPDL
jgi:uncharacterized membrane protein YeiH